MKFFRISIVLVIVFAVAVSASKSRKKAERSSTAVISGNRLITLTQEEIESFARKAATTAIRTRMPQIDVLNAILQSYRNDREIIGGKKEIAISGKEFARAYSKVENLFNKEIKENDPMFKSMIDAPEIMYSNFKAITLFGNNGVIKIRVDLTEGYEQELPFTFGAKIKMADSFEGIVRSSNEGSTTEIIFNTADDVFFKAPGIAFFIPDVYTRIAKISVVDGSVVGYVIGHPKSAKERFVVVSYNLSTCAKKSIKSRELSPDSFKVITSLQ